MHSLHPAVARRRLAPRVGLETLCNEIGEGVERPCFVVDVSEAGIRIERPYFMGRTPRDLQLEFELPGVDAVLWARGQTCFDQVRQVRGDLWRTTGIRLAAAAAHDFRLLRDFVWANRRIDERSESEGVGALPASPAGRGRSPRGIEEPNDRLCFASAYLRG